MRDGIDDGVKELNGEGFDDTEGLHEGIFDGFIEKDGVVEGM